MDEGDDPEEDEEQDGNELKSDDEEAKGQDDEKDENDIPGFDVGMPEEPLALEDVKSTEQRPLPKTNEEIVTFISALVTVEDDDVDKSLDYPQLAELAKRHPLFPEFCQRIQRAGHGAGSEWSFCHPEGDPLEDLRDFCLWIETPDSTTLGPHPTATTFMASDDDTTKARFEFCHHSDGVVVTFKL